MAVGFEHMVDNGEKRVGDGDDSALLAPACGHPALERGEVGTFLVRCRPSRLRQRASKPTVASFSQGPDQDLLEANLSVDSAELGQVGDLGIFVDCGRHFRPAGAAPYGPRVQQDVLSQIAG